jgi:hypothetical protein
VLRHVEKDAAALVVDGQLLTSAATADRLRGVIDAVIVGELLRNARDVASILARISPGA